VKPAALAVSGPVRRTLLDAGAVCLAVAGNLTMTVGPSPVMKPYGGVSLATLVLVSGSLVFRRRHPVGVIWFVTAVTAVMVACVAFAPDLLLRSGVDRSTVVWIPHAVPFAVYAAVVFAEYRRAVWVPVTLLAILAARPWPPNAGRVALQSLLLVVGPALLGMYVGARRRLMQAFVERVERVEREQHLLAEQARADERARLAAEMHDVVTHRVSLMVLQAGALHVTAGDEATRAAAEGIRATGCHALQELRDLVGILRDGEGSDGGTGVDTPHEPLPDFTPLIRASESVGVPVDVIEADTPALASAVIGRTAYRVVQEALTNVRKHAPGSRVRIQVSHQDHRVRLTIRNGPPTTATDTALAGAGSGTGLLGLQQRVELIGGVLSSRPCPDGGFELTAVLPVHVPAAPILESA
jgi:signal transduction histidine kinase